MPIIKTKYSDDGRSAVIRKSIESATSDQAQGISYLSDELLTNLQTIQPTWTEKVTALNSFLSAREKEVREKNDAVSYLETVLRDLWEVLKRRVKRLNQPVEVLTFYQLPLSGIVPNVKKEGEILALAAKVVEGDAKAVEAGYPAMTNPSVEELQQAITSATNEINDVAPADRQYDVAQEAVEELREPVDAYIKDIIDELKFNLRKRDDASKRRIMKSYGIEFVYSNGETEDDNLPLDDDTM